MTKIEQDLTEIIEDGQSGKYKSFIRAYGGRVRKVIECKNPLGGGSMIYDIDKIIEIYNPELKEEIAWFNLLQSTMKLWVNEKIIANRILGLKNDNEYDTRVFEKVILEKFFFLKEKPKPSAVFETDFATLIELVELGARRFGV